jgi:hypothetical protein
VQHDTCQGIRLPRWSPDLWQADNMATLTEIFKRHVVSGECTAVVACTYNAAQWGGQDKECGAVCCGLGMRFHMILAHAEAEASERVLGAVKVAEDLSYNTELKECKLGTGVAGCPQEEICRHKRRMVEANACWEHEMKKSADTVMSSEPADDESENDDSDTDAASTNDDLTADPDYDSDDQDDASSELSQSVRTQRGKPVARLLNRQGPVRHVGTKAWLFRSKTRRNGPMLSSNLLGSSSSHPCNVQLARNSSACCQEGQIMGNSP